MALKKWVFGTKLSQQITEQNANIDELNDRIQGTTWKTATLSNGWAPVSVVDTVQVKEFDSYYLLKGRVTGGTTATGTLIATLGTTSHNSDYLVPIYGGSSPQGTVYTANGGLYIRSVPTTLDNISFYGMVIPK